MLSSPVLERESHQSTAARYESLIRIAASVRAQKEPQDLFRLLIEGTLIELRNRIKLNDLTELLDQQPE